MKIIAVVLSYNHIEYTDRLCRNLQQWNSFADTIVFDNGSTPDMVSSFTTHSRKDNCRMTCGFNSALDIARGNHPDLDAVWFFTADCYFQSAIDPVQNMRYFMNKYPQLGIIHPSEAQTVSVCYDVKHDASINGVKIVAEYDFVCPLFTRKALDVIGSFNADLYHGWGLDFESSYQVRRAALKVGINHQLVVDHNTSATYDSGRDGVYQNREAFYGTAHQEMYRVFNQKYGGGWSHLFNNEYTEEIGKIYE